MAKSEIEKIQRRGGKAVESVKLVKVKELDKLISQLSKLVDHVEAQNKIQQQSQRVLILQAEQLEQLSRQVSSNVIDISTVSDALERTGKSLLEIYNKTKVENWGFTVERDGSGNLKSGSFKAVT